MIAFQSRSDRQRAMLAAVREALASFRGQGAGGNPMARFGELMRGPLAPYSDLILSSGGLLPIRTDLMRQWVMYGEEHPGEGPGIPRFLLEVQPVKMGLTAMGLAAIASGEGGLQRVLSEFLPEILKGRLFCYCITEPGAGTNTNKISTVAVEDGDGFRLNGQKTFISAADSSHYMVVVAKVVRHGAEDGIGTFVMETKTPGITMTEMDIAVLGDKQFTLYYDDVRLPRTALVGSQKATKGKKISASVFYTLNLERILVGLITLSICKEALARVVKHASENGASDATKREIARVKIKFELANLAIRQATEAYDNSSDPMRMGLFANMAKLVSTEAANEACLLALQLFGLAGLDRNESDAGALYEIARALRIIPINNEMILNFLGENLLGMPKSYR
jgi:acyl-CoA dehydrogenase